MPFSRWLVYALGGGLGHATRGLSLARAAARRGHSVHVLVNTPLPDAALRAPGVTVEEVPQRAGREGLERALDARLSEAWSLCVVDTFPRGLMGELAPRFEALPRARAWIHRDLTPAYAARPEVLEAARGYALALVPGLEERALLAEAVGARRTAPWLIRDAQELLSPEQARARLGAREGQRVVAVSLAGTEAESAEMAQLAQTLTATLGPDVAVRAASPSPRPGAVAHWPLLELLPGVDVLVGAGGYQTVNEARATGTSLVALARARLYDRQAERLRPEERALDAADAARRVETLLATRGPRAPSPDYLNGVHEAVAALEALR